MVNFGRLRAELVEVVRRDPHLILGSGIISEILYEVCASALKGSNAKVARILKYDMSMGQATIMEITYGDLRILGSIIENIINKASREPQHLTHIYDLIKTYCINEANNKICSKYL